MRCKSLFERARISAALIQGSSLRRAPVIAAVLAGSVALIGSNVHAQTTSTGSGPAYPAKTVRIIVPFAPGGSTDIVARAMSAKVTESMGQSFVVDNRAGAGGNIGADLAAKSAPDGYTLLLGHVGTLAINPALYKALPYDPIRDFSPITLAIASPLIVVVHPSFPAKTIKELIVRARSRPGEITFASAGGGSASHLGAELFNSLAQTKMVHVPYKGTGPATTAVVSGEVSLNFSGQGTSWPLINSGRLRALALTGTKRAVQHPQLPTVSETVPGYEVINWHGVLAPAATPPAIIKRLNAEFVKALDHPDVRAKLTADGFEVVANSPEDFAKFIRAEKDKWAGVIKSAGISLD